MTKYTVNPTTAKSSSNEPESYQNKTPSVSENSLAKEPPLLKTKKTILSRIVNGVGTYRLEILAFLLTFSYGSSFVTSTSMILEKVCLAHFKYPAEICDHLVDYPELKPRIERMATNYQLGHSLIQIGPAALLSCFVGPWSDTYGRKFPVVLALSGMTLDRLGAVICAHFLNSRVEFYYIPAIFSGFSGGIVSLLAVVYSYASDLTPVQGRTMKYAFIEIATGVGGPVGLAAGGWIFNFLGYSAVFLFATAGLLATLFSVLYFIPETRGMDRKESWREKFLDLFSFKTFKESFVATAKKRPFKGRRQIVLLILSMCFIVVSVDSTKDVNYLFVHHQFDWGNTKYSTITAFYSIFALVLLVIVVPLFKRIKISDASLGLVGTTSLLIKFVGMGLAYEEMIYYIANFLGLLSPCAALAARSRISKVVSNDDLGKVFSFVATAESLLPVLTSVLVSQIFNAFLTIFPGMPYIFLAVFLIIPLSVFGWLTRLPNLSHEEIHGKTEPQREAYSEI